LGLIEKSIVDDPPMSVKDGGFIRRGFNAELDEIRDARSHAKDWIANFEASERRRSGIQSLKVRYNRVFGYYIEITKSHLKSVPQDYIRKQTLANGERYITPDLKEYEAKVLNSEELMEKLELRLLAEVREQIAVYYPESNQILMLTGPNMAGKSTYMRQVALIVILAQMGSFVPAAEACVGMVDRIFTRIGASDSLARGESTFMVEMKETANILHHATQRSLILLDEVGRGTSTFDGISIAWAVAESLHDLTYRPRTLFATHYHEL